MQDLTDESEDEVEHNELGDELTPKTKPVEQIFEQNLYWRSSPKVAGKVQFSAVADGSAQDVRFQQSFQEVQLEPPEKSQEAFFDQAIWHTFYLANLQNRYCAIMKMKASFEN